MHFYGYNLKNGLRQASLRQGGAEERGGGSSSIEMNVIRSKRVVGVTKWREGLKKQHGVLFFPERDRTAVRPSTPTVRVVSKKFKNTPPREPRS